MTIVYQIDKMKTLFPTVELIQEMIDLATSATGTEQGKSLYNLLARIYRDTMDIWVVTARDDASSNKLVGTLCFGDMNTFYYMNRSQI